VKLPIFWWTHQRTLDEAERLQKGVNRGATLDESQAAANAKVRPLVAGTLLMGHPE